MFWHNDVRDAIKAKNLKAFSALLKKGFDLKHDFKKGWTALHLAAKSGSVEIVQELLERGAEVNSLTDLWRTPLDEAIHFKNDLAADLLMKHGGKRGIEFSIFGAAAAGNVSWVKKHLAKGVDQNVLLRGESPLSVALSRRQWETARYLISKKPDLAKPLQNGDTVLHIALENCAPDSILAAIVKLGVDVNAKNNYGQTPLSIAARAEDDAAIRFLFHHGANPKLGAGDANPLSEALQQDNFANARLLIDQGARATLHQAAECGHLSMVRTLVQSGADLEATDNWSQQTPLLVAVENEHPEVVEFLLESKADPNVQEHYRSGADTPLHLAVRCGSSKMVKLLLAAGADPDAQNSERLTPLELAKRLGGSHLVRIMDAHIDRNRREKAVEQLYTIHKVAELLSVDELFVLNLIKSGKLRELKLNPETIRVPESSLGRYLSSLES
jgi:ankyrin repeat protein